MVAMVPWPRGIQSEVRCGLPLRSKPYFDALDHPRPYFIICICASVKSNLVKFSLEKTTMLAKPTDGDAPNIPVHARLSFPERLS